MTKLYKFIRDKAVRDSNGSVQWRKAGSPDNEHYRAGASNACLTILDFMERNPDYNEDACDECGSTYGNHVKGCGSVTSAK